MVSVIVLYNKEGKMLLEHRSETRRSCPGYWALFGGHPEEGETPEGTVKREAKEELNYNLAAPVFLYTQLMEQDEDSEKHVFVSPYDETQSITLNPKESQGSNWLTLEEVKKLPKITQIDIESLEKVWEYIQQHLIK